MSIRDPAAEPSGFIFDGTGKVAFYHVQHGQQPEPLLDFVSNPVDGNTDDLIRITGLGAKRADDDGRGKGRDDDRKGKGKAGK
jgi:hypothetical protein